jgi:multiple sugar transport system ATP-binding protein
VMRKGELQQVAEPQELYDRPVNLFVGGFIGSPAMNMIEARLERSNGALVAVSGSQRIELGDETLSARPGLGAYEGREVILGIRPEDLEDAALDEAAAGTQRLHGEIVLTEALGSEVMAHFRVDAPAALTEDVRELAQDAGGQGPDERDARSGATMIGRFGARSKLRLGDAAEVAVDTRALHFFDKDTGLGIYDGTERNT